MSEIAENVQESLLALAVGTGLQVMQTMMSEDVSATCGPKGKMSPNRQQTPFNISQCWRSSRIVALGDGVTG